MKSFSLVVIFNLFLFSLSAQDFFKVELEKRSPGVQDIARSYEGYPVIPFIANDLNGNEQNLGAVSKEKHTILFFWNLSCDKCKEQLASLNLLKQNFGHKVDIISFADEDKRTVFEYIQKNPIDFSVIPNSKMLAEGPYGGDLGYPRLFIVDDYGLIRWVFAQESFDGGLDTYKVMETLLTQLEMERN